MTEKEWLASKNAGDMVRFLRFSSQGPSFNVRGRKYRLLACACVRQTHDLSSDEVSLNAVGVAERLADGEGSREDLAEARAARTIPAVRKTLLRSGQMAANDVCGPLGLNPTLSALVRCIFGNPFRTVPLEPACRTAPVISLAHAAYDEQLRPHGELDPDRLAILSDAIDEAGAGAELLVHLREPGLHVRGCHVIDALTGRA